MSREMFLAHINEWNETQTLSKHIKSTAEISGKFAEAVGCKNIGIICGLLHDMGKYTDAFQTYLLNAHDGNIGKKYNHSSAGACLIFDIMASDTDAVSMLLKQIIAEAVCCHHSGLCDNLSPFGIDGFSKRIENKEQIFYDEAYKNYIAEFPINQTILPLLEPAKKEMQLAINKISAELETPFFALGVLQKFIFSCLIDADRLDTACFMRHENLHAIDDRQALFKKLSINLESNLEKQLQAKNKATEINAYRHELSEKCKLSALKSPGIYALSTPTGGGKTLSSIRFALNHSIKFNKEKIFYIVPFTTIIDQNADVLRNFLAADETDMQAKNSIAEIHSAVINEKTDDEDEIIEKNIFSLITDRLEKPITLTTMVRFLNTCFGDKTQITRAMHQFANSVIIFDEIQALPIKCMYLFNDAVNFLAKFCGATVILCTATQPGLEKVKHKIISAELIEINSETKEAFRRVLIVPCDTKVTIGANETAHLIINKAKTESNALAIFNTKAAAEKVLNEVEALNQELPPAEKFEFFQLTTYECPAQRREILAEIKAKLKSNKKIICISTQLIEAGVDISFNTVFRSIAGLDSIIQAAGRCNRNKEQKIKEVYVLNPDFEKLAHLPDINHAKMQTFRLFDEYKANPDYFENNLISETAVKTYYKYYFAENESEMEYNLPKINKSIYEILNTNASANVAYRSAKGEPYKFALKQSFETAAKSFKAIESNTTSVLVPFKRGKTIINELSMQNSFKNKSAFLKEAQQYSVNLFDYEIKKLGNAVFQIADTGFIALNESYYSDKTGVSFENISEETLIL